MPAMPGRGPFYVVNRLSGGGTGAALARLLMRERSAEAVFDCADGSPMDSLRQAAAAGFDCVVVCGGDGTVTWMAESLRLLGVALPLAVWPLGTGNDIARSLGWPYRVGPKRAILSLETAIAAAQTEDRDRWVLCGPQGERPIHAYCSVGMDSRIALHFHRHRLRRPWLFPSSALNKLQYCLKALQDVAQPVQPACAIRAVPTDARTVVWSNIGSYAGGRQLDPNVSPTDRRLDGHCLGSLLPMGLVLAGARSATAIAARSFSLTRSIAMQIDGEPFVAVPGNYSFRYGGRQAFLRAHG